ncbi:hypothetical protein AVEN_129063-1 [Araneus ventricosus]|uniref:Uncharacterized protein n=1 Tax=Araneus ventricosus TaxID=182803 RepID=A0A4Y2TTY4_ARAVE|nr:hypothetical protein AVEN_129063-1 [Araneus ventricosus]
MTIENALVSDSQDTQSPTQFYRTELLRRQKPGESSLVAASRRCGAIFNEPGLTPSAPWGCPGTAQQPSTCRCHLR